MGVVVIPWVIFRLMASASRRTVPPLRGCGMRRRLPRPFVLACSRKAHPLGSSAEADDYNSTYPRSRFHGLGCPRSFDSLAPGSACPFGSRNCGIYPGLSQGPVLPSPSPKSLRPFHQTNRVNGITAICRPCPEAKSVINLLSDAPAVSSFIILPSSFSPHPLG